ncbi:hypothetical protein M2272_005764 [Mycobacterium frederiksbergense]|uniref:DUF2510 domain-containing protein n=1 Tax=Mycolicibacterium frederiksbergense TaxID=117567 RepID=A0ABT6LA48_9MYCO|nr:DUF2510 domain-containing protein [Mycolicibacterium frederiksbergense]MDH6199097.1 hypothetical protein [Mycolicibacterium frederiksbergense]
MTSQRNPVPAPGWYPDPGGQPGQRYHDGQRWAQHFVPTPPAVPAPPPAAPAVAVAVATGGGTNHALHLVLTLLTCGMWLPIWFLVAIFGGGSSSSVAVGSGAGVMARTSNRRPLLVAAVLGGLFALGVIAEHPWLIVVLAVVGTLAGLGVWALKSAKQREEQQRREQFERDMLSDRADYEDKLFQEGDPRGLHGRYPPSE